MAVHVAKEHGENFECGLCDYVAKDLEALEMHLFNVKSTNLKNVKI